MNKQLSNVVPFLLQTGILVHVSLNNGVHFCLSFFLVVIAGGCVDLSSASVV